MKRTLILDEDDLVMVVKEDVVKQVDENRGEMNRSEFVNYLIQTQLRQSYNQPDSVGRDEFRKFTEETKELLHNFPQFFVTYGMVLGRTPHNQEFHELNQQLESLDKSDEETEEL